VQVEHLASHILGGMAKRLSEDWEKIYGHPLYFPETFIDPARYRETGSELGADGGGPPGPGKDDQTNRPNRSIKEVWGYPLRRRFRELLSA